MKNDNRCPAHHLQPDQTGHRRGHTITILSAAQHRLELPRPLSHTTPDFYYGEEHQDHFQGICIYLDGLSRHIYGNENSRRRDQQIREWLRNNEYQVITIPASDLDSREVMRDHLYTIARYLLGRTAAREAVDTTDWFVDGMEKAGGQERYIKSSAKQFIMVGTRLNCCHS